MPSDLSQVEAAVIETVLPTLEAEGFEVFVQPSRTMLPAFLKAYRPDAIALKGDRKIAIEITSSSSATKAKVDRLRQLFSKHPDWEFRVVYDSRRSIDETIPVASKGLIEEHLKKIEEGLDSMGPAAALLTAWALFEAAGRSLIPASLGRPQTPARLVEALASDGYVTPDEADTLRRLSLARNEVAHGRLDFTPARGDVQTIVDATKAILQVGAQSN